MTYGKNEELLEQEKLKKKKKKEKKEKEEKEKKVHSRLRFRKYQYEEIQED